MGDSWPGAGKLGTRQPVLGPVLGLACMCPSLWLICMHLLSYATHAAVLHGGLEPGARKPGSGRPVVCGSCSPAPAAAASAAPGHEEQCRNSRRREARPRHHAAQWQRRVAAQIEARSQRQGDKASRTAGRGHCGSSLVQRATIGSRMPIVCFPLSPPQVLCSRAGLATQQSTQASRTHLPGCSCTQVLH